MAVIKKWETHEGLVLDTKNNYDIINCNQCGFNHCIPIPSQEELDRIYKQEYYSKEKPQYIDHMKQDFEWWQTVYNDRYDTFKKYLPATNRTLLDVGSGTGYFLLQGKNLKWDVLGIEPNKEAATYSRTVLGVKVVEEFLSDDLPTRLGKTFDVVHMSLVLEHIPNPKQLILNASKLLKSNGIICISVPNDYNPIQNTLVSIDSYNPWWVAPPHHINYFSFQSLRQLIEQCNFTFLEHDCTFPIDMFLLMGDNYIGNDIKGRECHTRRMNFEKKMVAAGLNDKKRALFKAMADIGIGREIIIFAQKKG